MEWPEPWSRLAACGWTTARLATLDDLPKRGLRELLEKAFGREATVEELEEFFQKVKECGSTGRIQWGVEVRREAPLARWPCRLSRLVGRAGDNMDLRDRAERSERTRWTVMLKRIIVESELPAAEGWNADPDGTAWHRIGKGRRSTTLRKHVKTWRHVATWLYSTFNVPWPRTIEQFIEYIMHRVAEPCGKSIPTSLMKTLMFIEVAGEVPEKERLCKHPALQNTLEEVNHGHRRWTTWRAGGGRHREGPRDPDGQAGGGGKVRRQISGGLTGGGPQGDGVIEGEDHSRRNPRGDDQPPDSVRDRMRFPGVDDLEAMVRQMKADHAAKSAVRLLMKYDVSRAHKLVPVKEQDWPLMAFSLDKPEEVFMRTVGAFGFGSAAYWW